MSIYDYNSTAIVVLAALKDLGVDVKVNRKIALSILRILLSTLTLTGGADTDTCLLTLALKEAGVDITLFSPIDNANVIKAFHKLLSISK
jgi:hypothetical protein